MRDYLKKFDRLAGVETENRLVRLLERAAFAFAILMFVFAPHSIAATQSAWLTGMFLSVIRFFLSPRPRLVRTPLDAPLWAFFAWSLVTSVTSYDAPTSLDKMRNVALFLIFYWIVNAVKTRRAAVFLASTMIVSAMVSVLWTPVERIFGRGVEIVNASAESPLTKAALKNGDTLLKADGVKIKTPDDLVNKIRTNERTKIDVYRPDYYFTVEIAPRDLLGGASALEQLGVQDWRRSRNWRSTGFYSHYTTFAEVLQLVAALAFGLFIASFARAKTGFGGATERDREAALTGAPAKSGWRIFGFSFVSVGLFLCVAAMSLALLLTVTRASQLGFLIAAAAIILTVGNRRMLLIAAAIALPVAVGGLLFLQQSRRVGFFDLNDDSTKDRITFYRKGFDLWTDSARHLAVGIGMDASKSRIEEWNLYDNTGKPMGHFHSTPLQLLVERGAPALFLWLWIVWVYARTLLRCLRFRISDYEPDGENPKSEIQNPKSLDWQARGIILGSFGGLIGFFAGGIVHYNLGDAEVAMVFFMLMGLSVFLSITDYELRITNSGKRSFISNS